MLFPTTIVGRCPQPEWLIDRKKLAGRFPPCIRAKTHEYGVDALNRALDCGMKYLPRNVADSKLRAMVQAAHILRKEYGQT